MNKFGIVFSSRVRSALLCVTSLWILTILGTSAAEIVTSYLNGSGFDASIRQVIILDLLFFLPYFVVAAFILRSLAARIAFFHLLKKQIVIPEYKPSAVFSPAEAGLLVDNTFAINEIAATIKDLELRGSIAINQSSFNMELQVINSINLDDLERQFIETLFKGSDQFLINNPTNAIAFLDAGKQLANSARARLAANGQIVRSRVLHKTLHVVVNTFIGIALVIQLMLTILALVPGNQVFSVGYPRHPMNISEPILEIGIDLLVLVICISGFWMRKLTDDHGLKNWRYTAGLKMFIEKAYKDRFYRDGKQMATDDDLRTFYPYAIAFGIEKRFTEKLKRALLL